MIRPQEQSIKFEGSLDEENNAIYALLEKTFLLESAAWKVGCFRENERRPSALTDCEKSNCRSTSGAVVIVPGVISFLENEPVIALLASIRRSQ